MNNRIIPFGVATLLLLVGMTGMSYAQDLLDITGPPTNSWESGTKVAPDKPITWDFHMTVGANKLIGHTNGFRVYLFSSVDGVGILNPGPGFSPLTYGSIDMQAAGDDGGFFISPFSVTGSGVDTVGFGGFAIFQGIPSGYDEDVYWITTQVATGAEGSYLCLDTSFYPPGGAWLWSTPVGNVDPAWSGPYCYYIERPVGIPASFDNCPQAALAFDHTIVATYDFAATDPDPAQCDPPGDGSVTFSMVSGIGNIDPVSGVWTYQPSLADVGPLYNIEVWVEDACGNGTECQFQVEFTNEAPLIDCGPGAVGCAGGSPIVYDGITVDPVDGDPTTFHISGVSPVPVGTYSIDANSGVITFASDDADSPNIITFTVCATDGADESCCPVDFEMLGCEAFEVQIEKVHNAYQGMHEIVDVTVRKGAEDMLGFDILIAYDASAMSFQTALPGSIYEECGWEYFTYRYGPYGNCGSPCPSGMIRVVGMAETNNGPNHPACFMGTLPFTLIKLDFLVTDDRTFECMYIPVRFFWMDCGDNAFAFHELSDPNPYNVKTAISWRVYEFEGIEMTDPTAIFPTYFGAPDVPCLDGDKEVPVRFVDFINGGIDIICADSIDDRGDLNLNGVANEISDAVLYTNYFVYGLTVFDHYQAQVAASDVNADGITLSVADLVYLIRVIVGDALAIAKIAPVSVWVTIDDLISVDAPMGAAFVILEGNVAPELLSSEMELRYAYDRENNITRALVYSMNESATFEGAFMAPNGTVVSLELATYEGASVKIETIPTDFTLHQNYPNPFNPTTTVSFDLPHATDYTLTVYNITGQELWQINEAADASGRIDIEIDGSDWASGIYFYRLDTGRYSKTRKMILLK